MVFSHILWQIHDTYVSLSGRQVFGFLKIHLSEIRLIDLKGNISVLVGMC